jgi:hypothetical protein
LKNKKIECKLEIEDKIVGRIEGKNAHTIEDRIADNVIMIEDLIEIKEDYPDNGKVKPSLLIYLKMVIIKYQIPGYTIDLLEMEVQA